MQGVKTRKILCAWSQISSTVGQVFTLHKANLEVDS